VEDDLQNDTTSSVVHGWVDFAALSMAFAHFAGWSMLVPSPHSVLACEGEREWGEDLRHCLKDFERGAWLERVAEGRRRRRVNHKRRKREVWRWEGEGEGIESTCKVLFKNLNLNDWDGSGDAIKVVDR